MQPFEPGQGFSFHVDGVSQVQRSFHMFFGGPGHVELDPRYTGIKELTSTEPV